MSRRAGLIAIGIAIGLLLGIFVYPLLAERVSLLSSRKPDGPATLTARGAEILDCWPVSRSWSWTVDPVASKSLAAVAVRTVEEQLVEGTLPAIPFGPARPRKGTRPDRSSGWAGVGENRLEGKVTCQCIDFREVGLGDAAGKQPLRLLVRLKISGGTNGINGAESILEGETLVGASEAEPRWVDDELHLLTIYTQSGNRLFAHHVLLIQSD